MKFMRASKFMRIRASHLSVHDIRMFPYVLTIHVLMQIHMKLRTTPILFRGIMKFMRASKIVQAI